MISLFYSVLFIRIIDQSNFTQYFETTCFAWDAFALITHESMHVIDLQQLVHSVIFSYVYSISNCTVLCRRSRGFHKFQVNIRVLDIWDIVHGRGLVQLTTLVITCPRRSCSENDRLALWTLWQCSSSMHGSLVLYMVTVFWSQL